MATLFIVSLEALSGKTALCVGLGRRFQHMGYSVGYMKPVSSAPHLYEGQLVDEDARYIKHAFELREPLTTLAPVCVDTAMMGATLRGEGEDYAERVKTAFDEVSRDRDIVFVEGGNSLREGYAIDLPAYRVSRLLNATEVAVIRYSERSMVDRLLAARDLMRESMLGAVINAVPPEADDFVQNVAVPFLEHHGVKVFATIPEEPFLRAFTVAELVEALHGEILCCPEAVDELVEYTVIGAMSVESALSYFQRTPNKAVVTGGDRPDVQLAALETSTRCLVLTGDLRPLPVVLARAQELGVPMILVKEGTLSAVEDMGKLSGKTPFHQDKKILRFEGILVEEFDFDALHEDMGIPG